MADVRRLLQDIIPERYRLAIDIAGDGQSFQLLERIDFELARESAELTFHAVDLELTRVVLDGDRPGSASFNHDDQTVTLTFAQSVKSGRHSIEVAGTGLIQDSLHGFYRSAYKGPSAENWFYMTQFEAIHAREVFMGIDEPAAKAIFEVSLTVAAAPGYTVLGNTPILRDETKNGRRTVSFEPTPRMSTYLLAWVVSQLNQIEGKSKSGVQIRVLATPQYPASQLEYALSFASRSLDYYENYFAINYPLPKLDLVACPNFAAGAMENWGLVTYRETDLLVDPATTSLAQRQRVSEVIAHELAHMWFGDLVTMSWWESLWLNESFASWAETMTVDALEPSWKWWAHYTAGLGVYAREVDSLANTHPILVDVPDPKGLDEIFDAISYFKGQGLLRMLEGYLGAEAFRSGLQLYLQKHAYQNTETDDLWNALSEASGKDVAGLMHSWTTLPGFPVLSYSDGLIKQERFFASPRERQRWHLADKTATVWPVPFVALLPENNRTEPMVLSAHEVKIPKAMVTADWFKPNPAEQGFYRSAYSAEIISSLRGPLQSRLLGVADRFGVVSDVWAATSGGYTSSAAALELTVALRDEPEFIAALAVYDGLGSLLGIVEDQSVRERLEKLGRWLAEPNYVRLGWEERVGEDHFETLLRPVALTSALRFEVEGAKHDALERFEQYVHGQALDPNIRSAVFYGAARYGGTTEYNQLLDLYRHESSPHTRQAQLINLGRFTQPDLVQRTLALSLSDEVKLQDVVYGLAGVWRARENRDLAWDFLRDQWPELVERFGEGGHMLDRFPGFPGGAFATHARAAEVREFFDAHPHILITRPAAQAVETIELKADWYQRDKHAIKQSLDSWGSNQQ